MCKNYFFGGVGLQPVNTKGIVIEVGYPRPRRNRILEAGTKLIIFTYGRQRYFCLFALKAEHDGHHVVSI